MIIDTLFEISWEVCNKVGGINTVIATKSKNLKKKYGDNHILIGPDIVKEQGNEEFIEDTKMLVSWRNHLRKLGINVRAGRWNIAGKPAAILIDFTGTFSRKDEIFSHFWERYKLDSLNGQWDYIEPAMFGYVAGKVILSYHRYFLHATDRTVAHFHEWMTGAGILFLKENAPFIATAFTTHATILGRTLAGNGLPFYGHLDKYLPEAQAKEFNIQAKYSMESISAREADVFTTVSDLTAVECKYLLKKEVDIVTPNGFDDAFVPTGSEFTAKRNAARTQLKKVAEAVLGYPVATDAVYVINSGRYEFRNKGIDVFIEALKKVKESDNQREVIAFITVPAGQKGACSRVLERLNNPNSPGYEPGFLTHELTDPAHDPILSMLHRLDIKNRQEDKVKIIFAPVYLNGSDGIFNLDYYDVLIGFDLSVFPSYYEPWGYTPMESLAFKVPTITTSLAGFGLWIDQYVKNGNTGAVVIRRDDDNYFETIHDIAEKIRDYVNKDQKATNKSRKDAKELSKLALWDNLIEYYEEAYGNAITESAKRVEELGEEYYKQPGVKFEEIEHTGPVWKKALVKPKLPARLQPLFELSQNLWWTWNDDAEELFERIDPAQWKRVEHNPVAFIEGLSMHRLQQLENDNAYCKQLDKVYKKFRDYMNKPPKPEPGKIAYFSMEYGMHDTVKIFSGGLGILAGDYIKEASDYNIDMTAIGLLYRFGYFKQKITIFGDQIAEMSAQKFTHMPLKPVRDENGNRLLIELPLPGRTLYAQVWRLDVGRVKLYLLDADIEKNAHVDKKITYQLYGGGHENRFLQELLLGIGGIRLINKLNLSPEMYHCNEGHAAMIGLERLRNLVQDYHLHIDEAKEVVRASTLFTTHTPVPAGHDAFKEDVLRTYLPNYANYLGINWEELMALGRVNKNNMGEKFSMSVLAARLSQEMNGVSKIHGRVSRKMFANLYPGYYPNELHISHVTNGVHLPTWAAKRWKRLYHQKMDTAFYKKQEQRDLWKKINGIDAKKIWDIRNKQRKELIAFVKERLTVEMTQRQEPPKQMVKTLRALRDDVLTIGFARRFATYKRANLLFSNLELLNVLINDPKRPVQFLFAGKAHPADKAGQDLIKRIIEISRMPEFSGKIVFIENYDINLAKKLISGVDVWLNNPTRPLEASGTSGEKAVMNGVLNLSVLDGWWAEGYREGAGWALPEERTYDNQDLQNNLDAGRLYFLLQDEIIPAFYRRDSQGIPDDWVDFIKKNIWEIAPNFTMNRMLRDYIAQFYEPQILRTRSLRDNNFAKAKKIAAWKKKVRAHWDEIEVIALDFPNTEREPFELGAEIVATITLRLPNLHIDDIGVEIIFSRKSGDEVEEIVNSIPLKPVSFKSGIAKYQREISITQAGVFNFAFRVYPRNADLPHRQDFGIMEWI